MLSALKRQIRPLNGWVVKRFFEQGDLIETHSEAHLSDFGLDDPNRNRYVAISRFVVPRVLRKIGVGPDDVFIDIGCGKGRAVYQAAQFPFKRVIGVEIAEELTRVAQYNIDNNRDQLAAKDVELVTEDALKYQLPDDVTVVYLFHPFAGEIFAGVIKNLVASLDRNPRELRIIYILPASAEYILETGRFELERNMKAARASYKLKHWYDILVFRSVAPGAPAGDSSRKIRRAIARAQLRTEGKK
jgi:SAM-dependent methyltransferase